MKLTNENINEYFSVESKTFNGGPMLPNVLIRPKGFPPINTPISLEQFATTFSGDTRIRLQVSETGEVCFASSDKTLCTGIPVASLDGFIR